jgi:hypothetical protein
MLSDGHMLASVKKMTSGSGGPHLSLRSFTVITDTYILRIITDLLLPSASTAHRLQLDLTLHILALDCSRGVAASATGDPQLLRQQHPTPQSLAIDMGCANALKG